MRSLTPTHVHRRTAESGFSLIVMSILITVAAIILVSLLPGDEAGDYNAKAVASVKKLNKIEEAMRSFMAANGRRPCPADGQYPINSRYFGQEAGTPGTCTGNVAPTPNAPMGPDSGTGRIVAGTIPVRTLGLPEDYAFDSYGRRFTYTVDLWATKQASCQSMYAKKSTGDLVIEDGTHTVIDNVMYAYTSHGPSGYGAFPGEGSATALTSAQSAARRVNSGSTDADMQTNAGVDAVGANSTFTYNTTNFTNIRIKKDRVLPNLPATTGFDDLVWYRDDLKNTCCLGQTCVPLGIRIDGTNPSGYAAQEIGLHGVGTMDINGDGKPDLIILGNDYHIYIIFGDTRTNLLAESPLKLSSLNGTNGIDINLGLTSWPGNGGMSIVKGDFNGDGVDDLAIADNQCNPTYLHILFGHTGAWTSPVTLWSLNRGTTPAVINTSNNSGFFDCSAKFPMAAASIRGATNSVTGLPIQDIVIGEEFADENGKTHAGAAFVIFGNQTLTNIATTVASLNGSNGFQIDGYKDHGTLGETLTTGDFNHDGYPDIAIGAPNSGEPVGDGGNSNGYIIWGQPLVYSWPAAINVDPGVMTAAQGVEINRNGNGVWVGYGLDAEFGSGIMKGDIDGDGIDDLVFNSNAGPCSGGAGCGSDHIIFGASSLQSSSNTLNLSTIINGTNGAMLEGDGNPGSTEMNSLVGMADTTGTGKKTIVTGVQAQWGDGTIDEYVALYPYAAFPWPNPIRGDQLNGTTGFRFTSIPVAAPGSHAALGDIDGDGISDYLITVPSATVNGKANAGKVCVVRGGVSLPSVLTPSTYSNYGYEIDGANAGDLTGGSIRVLDFDNDGHNDVVVGAPYASPNGKTNAGSVYVVWGKQAGWKTSVDLSTIGN